MNKRFTTSPTDPFEAIYGGILKGLSCEASKNQMAAVVNFLVDAIELYYSILAMVSLGSFAAAAVALRAVTIWTLLKAIIKKQVKKKRTECDCEKKKR